MHMAFWRHALFVRGQLFSVKIFDRSRSGCQYIEGGRRFSWAFRAGAPSLLACLPLDPGLRFGIGPWRRNMVLSTLIIIIIIIIMIIIIIIEPILLITMLTMKILFIINSPKKNYSVKTLFAIPFV